MTEPGAALQIREQVDLHHLNTFHVAAQARYFTELTDARQLPLVCQWLQEHPMPYMLIGQASNILFRQDYPGLIIELNIKGIRQLDEANDKQVLIAASGGEIWHELVLKTLAAGWYGLENLSLIPGTVGAAPVQNIGAYGVELSEFVEQVNAVEIATGKLRQFSKQDCEFAYRSSVFKQGLRDQYIISEVLLRLSTKPKLKLEYPALQQALAGHDPARLTPKQVSDAVCEIRRSKLPDPELLGNAGSFFWNPLLDAATFAALKQQYPEIPGYPETGPGASKIKVPAAWLIQQAGWKGYREGDVGVHREHALVLVNYGQASGAALVALSEQIQASVLAKFGIQLWPEVRIV